MPLSPWFRPWARAGLVLLLLVLAGPAHARPESESWSSWDAICGSERGGCAKLRLHATGGVLLTNKGPSLAGGGGGSLTFMASRLVELGVQFRGLGTFGADLEGLGSGEFLVRLGKRASHSQRAFLDLSAGMSITSPLDRDLVRFFPSGTVGVSLEVSTKGIGVFIGFGVSVLRFDSWGVLPHASLGLVF